MNVDSANSNSILQHLSNIGAEINTEKKDYIVLRYRLNSKMWTHLHRNDRNTLCKVTGPEKDLLDKFKE